MAYLERIHVEYSLFPLTYFALSLPPVAFYRSHSCPVFQWIQELTTITRNWRWTVISHTENNYTRREKTPRKTNSPPNGMKQTWLVNLKWKSTQQSAICFVFYWLWPFSLSPHIQLEEYFHNNYRMANNRWGILLSALNRVASRLHHFIHSGYFSPSFFVLFSIFPFHLSQLPFHWLVIKACHSFWNYFSSWVDRTRSFT